MAAIGAFPIKVDSNLHGFAHVLKSAVCEWLLLFFLLLDAAFSYFLTKFAQYCELQVPCILCSRLDHILGKEKPDFYRDLLCSNHKLEISSLVSCCTHGKLVDVRGMCEECILSFAKNESSEEIYKILASKLGSDCLQKPLVSLDSCSLSTRTCSCCSKPWRTRPNVQKLVQSKTSAPALKPDVPLPKSYGLRCLHRQEGLKKRRNRFSLSSTPLVPGSTDFDSLSHVGYTEVKISSDSDSDLSFSDDDETITVPRNLSPQHSILIPKSQYDDIFPAAPFPSPATNGLIFPHLEPEKGENTTPRFLVPNGDARKDLEEIKWQEIVKKASLADPKIFSLNDIPVSSSAPDGTSAISTDHGDRISLANKFDASDFSEYISHNSSLPPNNAQSSATLSEAKNVESIKPMEFDDRGHASTINDQESKDLTSISTDSTRRESTHVYNNDSEIAASDLASIANKEVKASNHISDQLGKSVCNGFESTKEPTASILSDPQTDLPSSNLNSIVNGHVDNLQKTEIITSVDPQMPLKSPKMERCQSLESLEESVREIQGESLIDKLKRQVEYNKKQIDDLHKEVEEERNAAAIAANQAMAMITKLQEEKAALNMEALQYLRMMEEQAEYDVDALEKANDIIAEKDKEIQDLESELDYFRMKYPEDFPEMNEEMIYLEDLQGSYTESIEIEKS